MPVIVAETGPLVTGGGDLRVARIQVSGGELFLVRRGADTLWSRQARLFAGIVSDSSSGRVLSGAHLRLDGTEVAARSDSTGHFSLWDVIPGEYTLEIRTASLDSIGAVHRTPVTLTDSARAVFIRVPAAADVARARPSAILAGSVVDQERRPI